MSRTSKIFQSIPIDIPNRSGMDLSHEFLSTLLTGTLTPVLCEEVIPGETYNLGHLSQVTMPPMATNFYGRLDLRIEAFFVPMRILWSGWQNFFTMPVNNPFQTQGVIRPTSTPSVTVPVGAIGKTNNLCGPGSLADFLGAKLITDDGDQFITIPNALPFFAYHRIYDDWYRNKNIQTPLFINTSITTPSVFNLPWVPASFNFDYSSSQCLFKDGVNLLSTRQRNWAKDNFTTAALYPQASGDITGSVVEFPTDGATGQISIPAIRSANVLQRWEDRNSVAGIEYADQIKAHYGVLPSDAIMNRAILLGTDIMGIYNRSVASTSQNDIQDTRNPFAGNVGSLGATAQGFKDGSLAQNFSPTEHGYIVVLASIVPHAYYSTGIRRQLWHSVRGDFAVPLLQGLGEQPIYQGELTGDYSVAFDRTKIFGYQQQYYEYKYHDDEVHGLLQDGSSLQAFALQRSFAEAPELGTEFLQIPTNFLDQVQAVDTATSGFSAWLDMYISLRKVTPLSEYVIPTLGDLKNTHKEEIPYRGRML